MLKKIITIEGMHCSHCAASVEKAIGELSGIKDAKVNLDKKVCVARLSGEVSDEAIKNAVTEVGFEFVGVETKKSLF